MGVFILRFFHRLSVRAKENYRKSVHGRNKKKNVVKPVHIAQNLKNK